MTNYNNAAPHVGTSSGGRAYIADYFATQLRRHDFATYINITLAADFACALAQHLSKVRAEGVQASDEETPPIMPDDEEIAGACINASDIDGIAYDGPSFERGYRAALANAPVAGEAAAIPLRPLTEDERAAVEFYTTNPTAAVRDLDKRLSSRPALASAPLPRAEVTAALDWLDDFVARCNGDDRGVCESVNLLRRALASAPVAGHDGAQSTLNRPESRASTESTGGALTSVARKARPLDWQNALRIAELSEVDEALATFCDNSTLDNAVGLVLAVLDAAPQASEAVRILFPAHLRKMWSGGEVQAWLDEHQGITPPKASAKGSMARYRKWQSEQTQADKDGCANG